MEVEDNSAEQLQQQTLSDILYGVKTQQIKLTSKRPNNIYDIQKEKLINYFVKEGILTSISLCKLCYQIVLDDYMNLCKTASVQQMEQYTKKLFNKEVYIQQQLKTLLKKRINQKLNHSVEVSINNIRYLLKFNAGMRKEQNSDQYEVIDHNYFEMYYYFEEFIKNHYNKFIENLAISLKEDSIVFDDPQRQDEFFFIIVYPEEYLMNKFIEYRNSQLSCVQRDKAQVLHLSEVLLEDNNFSQVDKEDILQMMQDIEEKQNQPIIINPLASITREESTQQLHAPINKCNPFLKKNVMTKQ